MTPFVNLLARHVVTMRNQRYRNALNSHRSNDRQFLIVIPAPPPFNTENLAPHDTLRIRHVSNDVVRDVP